MVTTAMPCCLLVSGRAHDCDANRFSVRCGLGVRPDARVRPDWAVVQTEGPTRGSSGSQGAVHLRRRHGVRACEVNPGGLLRRESSRAPTPLSKRRRTAACRGPSCPQRRSRATSPQAPLPGPRRSPTPVTLEGMNLLAALVAILALAGPAPPAPPVLPRPGTGVWPLADTDVVRRFDGPEAPWDAAHRGVDLSGRPGQRVRAALSGTVVFAGVIAGRGVVSVDHGGFRTTYEPVLAQVARGDPVERGQPVGVLEVAGTHCAPSACLHWGLRVGERYLDPLVLVGAKRVRLLPLGPSRRADERAGRRS